jgi:peptidoglycan/xylan/chitin deacetylase (PgdA/CDA1 family)
VSLVFTFDDGPGPQTEELAGYLAEQKIPATFFMVGKHVRGNPEAVTRLRELGHRIGNHTENHLHLTNSSVSDRQALAEFLETDKLLQELGVPAPYYFRPP